MVSESCDHALRNDSYFIKCNEFPKIPQNHVSIHHINKISHYKKWFVEKTNCATGAAFGSVFLMPLAATHAHECKETPACRFVK